MNTLLQIKKPIQNELETFNKDFKKVLKSRVPLLNIILNYVVRNKGKQIRPLFVFLSARLINNIQQSTYTAANLVELLHNATLIHDDVIDESFERRNFFSINALWKSKVAVLIGDYLLAKGLLLALDHKEYELLHIVSDAVREMSEGEIQQIKNIRKKKITEEEYFEVITKKTASLISACTESGAHSSGATKNQQELMKKFGLHAGIAFQIKDDLFDYEHKKNPGKPRGNDIKEKKITLPLVHALEEAPVQEQNKILYLLRKKNHKNKTINMVIEFAHLYKGVTYAKSKMQEHVSLAIEYLHQFPENEARQSLEDLLTYSINREK